MIRLLLLLCCLLAPLVGHAQPSASPEFPGVLERWSYEPSSGRLELQGWALAGKDGKTPPSLKLSISDLEFEAKDLKWHARTDVRADNPVTGGQIGLGFKWSLVLPANMAAGVHPLKVEAAYSGGRKEVLPNAYSGAVVVIEKIRGRHWWMLGIVVVALILIQSGWIGRRRSVDKLSHWVKGNGAYFLGAGIFVVLVAFGITGSSIGLVLKSPYGQSLLDNRGSDAKIFSYRSIRADEWGVLMPNVLAQLHHEPPFPVVNTNIGPNGQNMGVIGMTGVPVGQLAAFARPSTWGYFFLPLRQAMSWQWQLPFWGGLLAVWCLLNFLQPGRRGLNLALSFAFAVAPYAAAWSNWPLYATMFPAFAFVLVCRLLTVEKRGSAVLLGLALGWTMAAWFLVLYPAWLITVGSVLLLVGVGWCIDQRSQLRLGWPQIFGFIAAILVILILLGSWWLDTRDAVALMKATEYPGKRGTILGGDMAWWWHLRGYTNADAVLRMPGPDTNQSEISSYFLLPLLIIALCITHWVKNKERRWMVAGCAAFVVCYWVYGFIGFPLWISKYSLWGNAPTGRMEVGMGLVTCILIALFAAPSGGQSFLTRQHKVVGLWNAWMIPGVVAMASALLIAATLVYIPKTFMPGGSAVYSAAMMVAGAAICWWIMRGRTGAAVAMLIAVHLLTTLAFNPVGKAPRNVELAEGNIPFVTDPAAPGKKLRTLAVNGGGVGPLMMSGVGVPMANGALYYPHKRFWVQMGLPDSQWSVVNRYQHLLFSVDPEVKERDGFSVSSPAIDHVLVRIDPLRFDFSRTGVQRVVVLTEHAQGLHFNSSLIFLGKFRDFHWFAVKDNSSDYGAENSK